MTRACVQIVCNASSAHCQGLDKINELIKTCNEQGETIKSLLGGGADPSTTFASSSNDIHHNRMAGQKRSRMNDEVTNGSNDLPQAKHLAAASRDGFSTSIKGTAAFSSKSDSGGDAWDLFSQMMHQESKGNYY